MAARASRVFAACAVVTLVLCGDAAAAKLREVREFATAPGTGPHGLAFAPAPGAFYATPGRGAAIGCYDFLGRPAGRVDAAVAAGAHAAFDARGDQLVLVDRAGAAITTLSIDGWLGGPAAIRTRPLRLGPARVAGIALDPVTDRLFVLDGRSRRIAAVPGAVWRTGAAGSATWIGVPGEDLRGLAFDAATGRLAVLDAASALVRELDDHGRTTRAFDIGGVRLRDPRALVSAASGDLTDDPRATSLYVADPGAGRVVELAPERTAVAPSAAAAPATLVRTIDTSRWSPPSPDPSGVAYDSAAGRLLVVDGEVEEMSIYAGANYYEATTSGSLVRTTNTLRFSPEPVGLAFDPGGAIFVSDDDQRRVFRVALGADGRFGSGDAVTSFSTTSFGSGDPEGLGYDRTGNRLFIADGVNSEIYVVSAVDAVFGNGNDQVQHFDTASRGVADPELVEFNPEAGTLYTMGDDGERILELTTSGALVAEIDVSSVPFVRPAGLAYAPRSTAPAQKSLYIADRKEDNDGHPNENDGTIYEIAVGADGGGGSPVIDRGLAAGADDAEEAAAGAVDLTSSDLELVTDGSVTQTVGLRFTSLPIPAGATITAAHLQLVADEAQSVATNLTIRAHATDSAPAFTTAAGNISTRPITTAQATWTPPAWTIGTTHRSPDLTAIVREITSRPGWASGNAIALIATGSGHRTAEAFESGAATAPLLHVEFATGGTTNTAPTVNAGPDQTITLPTGAALDGTVSDDGRPNPTPTTTWSRVSGPGTVTFANPSAVDTQASFSAAGTYVLRLTANDGALTSSDEVTIEVRAAGTALVDRRVAAGADDAEEAAAGAVDLTSSDLELVTDGSITQTIGVRFASLPIPAGATITAAHLQLVADEAQSVATNLTIRAHATDSAPAFSPAAGNISTRPTTTAQATWTPPAWTIGTTHRSPDLTAVVRQITNRPGWASGNAIALVITGSGHRTAEAFESGAASAPLLHIEYE